MPFEVVTLSLSPKRHARHRRHFIALLKPYLDAVVIVHYGLCSLLNFHHS
jgi:hypothetical protein